MNYITIKPITAHARYSISFLDTAFLKVTFLAPSIYQGENILLSFWFCRLSERVSDPRRNFSQQRLPSSLPGNPFSSPLSIGPIHAHNKTDKHHPWNTGLKGKDGTSWVKKTSGFLKVYTIKNSSKNPLKIGTFPLFCGFFFETKKGSFPSSLQQKEPLETNMYHSIKSGTAIPYVQKTIPWLPYIQQTLLAPL